MIFKNRNIGNEVTIDLDTYFYYFVRPQSEIPPGEKQGITLFSVRERLNRLYPVIRNQENVIKNGPWGICAKYRRSSNDHAHVKLTFISDLTVLDAFMIRAFMLDDQTRLELDLARYLLTDDLHEMNRCFDEKATIDGIKKSGPWIPLDYDRDTFCDIVPEARDDWNEYLPRWTEQYKRILKGRQEEMERSRKLDQIEKKDQEQLSLGFA